MSPIDFVRVYSDFYSKLEGHGPDLQGADLSGLYLRGINFRFANLQGANLSHSVLTGADFRGANLEGALLCFANLEEANFGLYPQPGALEGGRIVFEKTNLQRADLSNANLRRANLETTILDYVNFCGANLRFARIDKLPITVRSNSLTQW